MGENKGFKKESEILVTFLNFVDASFPWDQTTPIGYFAEVCFAVLNNQVILTVDNQVLLIFVFMCKNYFAFAEMYANFIDEFDWTQGMQKSSDSIRKLVDFHSDIKRWVKYKFSLTLSSHFFVLSIRRLFMETCSVFSFSIANMFVVTVVVLASCLFIFEMVLNSRLFKLSHFIH